MRMSVGGAEPSSKISWSTPGSAERNRSPILEALRPHFSECRRVLEIASGFGTHVVAYAEAFPDVVFQPTECDEYLTREISREIASHDGLSNVREPQVLDVTEDGDWNSLRKTSEGSYDLVVVNNLLHIAPWKVTLSLFKSLSPLPYLQPSESYSRPSATESTPGAIGPHASTSSAPFPPILDPASGKLSIYGAFKRDGQFSSDGDAKFDDTIRRRDPSFGLRDLSEVVTVAEENGFELVGQIPMPSNNLMLCFKPKSGVGTAASGKRPG